MKIAIFFSLILFITAKNAYPETVTLKNGKVYEGTIIEKTDDYIKLFFRGVPLKYYFDEIESISEEDDADSIEKKESFSLFPVDSAFVTNIDIHPLVELDFKTKADIYEMRKQSVSHYPDLAPDSYSPSEAVFGSIADGKPWWGILGLSYYGPGNLSIEGDSEESRFLLNPFLLVGLNDAFAYTVHDTRLPAVALYPKLVMLQWDIRRTLAKATYSISGYWRKKELYYSRTGYEHGFQLVAYNARDFGFNYLYIDAEKSKNILPCQASAQPVLIKQFIHCGTSCGYPGGCNNGSPDQPELLVKLSDVPALLYIKLWKKKPFAAGAPQDMIFVIELM